MKLKAKSKELAKLEKRNSELTPEILRAFISRIVVHEREQKWSKGGNQQIDIYFNHIGNISA